MIPSPSTMRRKVRSYSNDIENELQDFYTQYSKRALAPCNFGADLGSIKFMKSMIYCQYLQAVDFESVGFPRINKTVAIHTFKVYSYKEWVNLLWRPQGAEDNQHKNLTKDQKKALINTCLNKLDVKFKREHQQELNELMKKLSLNDNNNNTNTGNHNNQQNQDQEQPTTETNTENDNQNDNASQVNIENVTSSLDSLSILPEEHLDEMQEIIDLIPELDISDNRQTVIPTAQVASNSDELHLDTEYYQHLTELCSVKNDYEFEDLLDQETADNDEQESKTFLDEITADKYNKFEAGEWHQLKRISPETGEIERKFVTKKTGNKMRSIVVQSCNKVKLRNALWKFDNAKTLSRYNKYKESKKHKLTFTSDEQRVLKQRAKVIQRIWGNVESMDEDESDDDLMDSHDTNNKSRLTQDNNQDKDIEEKKEDKDDENDKEYSPSQDTRRKKMKTEVMLEWDNTLAASFTTDRGLQYFFFFFYFQYLSIIFSILLVYMQEQTWLVLQNQIQYMD